MNLQPVRILRGFSWHAMRMGSSWQGMARLTPPLPKPALRWIGMVRRHISKIPEPPVPGFSAGREALQVYEGEAWEVDLNNAYLHTALSLGYITHGHFRAALFLRRRYGVKPAQLLGMALGGRVVEELYYPDGRRTVRTVVPPSAYFLTVAHTTYQLMSQLAHDTGAIAWYVDALLYRERPDLMQLRMRLAHMLGQSPAYIGFKMRAVRTVFHTTQPPYRIALYAPDMRPRVWVMPVNNTILWNGANSLYLSNASDSASGSRGGAGLVAPQ